MGGLKNQRLRRPSDYSKGLSVIGLSGASSLSIPGIVPLLSLCVGLLFAVLPVDVTHAKDEVRVDTRYHSKSDLYITKGWVKVDVPMGDLARVAGALDRYRVWALRNINIRQTETSTLFYFEMYATSRADPWSRSFYCAV